jgi:hypothetical protein
MNNEAQPDNPVADLIQAIRAAYEPSLLRLLRWIVRVVYGEPDPPPLAFEEKPTCPKCQYLQFYEEADVLPVKYVYRHGVLVCECPRCGAKWNMRTADAEEPQP